MPNIELSWNTVAGADRYRIDINDGQNVRHAFNVKRSLVVGFQSIGRGCRVRVTACRGSERGAPSEYVTIDVPQEAAPVNKPIPLGQVTGLHAAPTDKPATITYQEFESIQEKPVLFDNLAGAAAPAMTPPVVIPPDPNWVTGPDGTEVVDIPYPALGAAFVDPTYGSTLHRITDGPTQKQSGQKDMMRNDYSKRSPANADNTRAIMFGDGAWWNLFNISDLTNPIHIGVLNGTGTGAHTGPTGDAECQWHPTDPNKFTYLVRQSSGASPAVYEMDVSTNVVTLVTDWSSLASIQGSVETNLYTYFGTAPGAVFVSGSSEGKWSKDGDYRAFIAFSAASGNQFYGAFIYQRSTNSIVGMYNHSTDAAAHSIPVGASKPGHATTSQNGEYMAVQWGAGFGGSRIMNRACDSSYTFIAVNRSGHDDWCLDKDNNDVHIQTDFGSGQMIRTDPIAKTSSNMFAFYDNSSGGGLAYHITGQCPPGWVGISTYAEETGSGVSWYRHKAWLHRLSDGLQHVLCHNHWQSTTWTQQDQSGLIPYFAEPHGSCTYDGSLFFFNSNWAHVGGDPDVVNCYVVDVRALPAA